MRNVEALRRIADQIERMPDSYDQEAWFTYFNKHGDHLSIWEVAEEQELDVLFPDCGTHACIAGHAIIDAGYGYVTGGGYYTNREQTEEHFGESSLAAHLLGLTELEASMLFLGTMKPKKGTTAPEMLRALADGARVSEVIETPFYHGYDFDQLRKEEDETLAG